MGQQHRIQFAPGMTRWQQTLKGTAPEASLTTLLKGRAGSSPDPLSCTVQIVSVFHMWCRVEISFPLVLVHMLYSVCHVKCLLQCVTYVYSMCTKVLKVCLPTYLQGGNDCFLLACRHGHEEIVRELLTKDKVDQNVVNNVRNWPLLVSLSTLP